MGESLITMSIAGLLAGFIFSMPIAGPISILITSNALNGRIRYCNRLAIGAAFAEFIYVYLAVFGITKLYSWFKPAMPYILGVGAIFIVFVGYKVFRSRVDLEQVGELSKDTGAPVIKQKGGLYTGFMINFLNPTLFFGSLTSSLLLITFVASLGFNTGGLNTMINQNVKALSSIDARVMDNPSGTSYFKPDTLKFLKNHLTSGPETRPSWFPLLISLCYAMFLGIGSVLWFLTMTVVIARFRRRINLKIINGIIKSLGVVLALFGVFFAYTAIKMLL
jgi:threonine/homoserine/homoserine lactone efflux protein